MQFIGRNFQVVAAITIKKKKFDFSLIKIPPRTEGTKRDFQSPAGRWTVPVRNQHCKQIICIIPLQKIKPTCWKRDASTEAMAKLHKLKWSLSAAPISSQMKWQKIANKENMSCAALYWTRWYPASQHSSCSIIHLHHRQTDAWQRFFSPLSKIRRARSVTSISRLWHGMLQSIC